MTYEKASVTGRLFTLSADIKRLIIIGDDIMYGIKLNDEYVLMNADNSGAERFNSFEDAVDTEPLYPDYETAIIEF